MKKLLTLFALLCGGILTSQAEDWGTTKTALDTMVNAKIVRWSKSVPKDSLAKTFNGVANSYGNSAKPSYTAGGSGGSTGSGGFDIGSILGTGSGANDTLVVSRADGNNDQYVAEDTIYFKGAIDEKRLIFKDSIFVTRLSHYVYVKGSDDNKDNNTISISVKDAGTLKFYAVPATGKATDMAFQTEPDAWTTATMNPATQQATVNWNNFGESVVNYNLSNPPSSMTFSLGGSGDSTTPKDTTLNCYGIIYF